MVICIVLICTNSLIWWCFIVILVSTNSCTILAFPAALDLLCGCYVPLLKLLCYGNQCLVLYKVIADIFLRSEGGVL